jgi:hypothetical protein
MKPDGRRAPILVYTICALVLITISWLVASGRVGTKEIGAAFLAMVGTLVGALLAFRLQEDREELKIERQLKAALDHALFVAARQFNALRVLWERDLAPFVTEFDRAFNLPALRPPPYADLVHDLEGLHSLLDIADPNILMRLLVEQETFHQVFRALELRNNFYIEEIQPAIAALRLNKTSFTLEEITTALGQQRYQRAVNESATIYSLAGGAVQSLPAIHRDLFTLAKQAYPGSKFIRLDLEEQPA